MDEAERLEKYDLPHRFFQSLLACEKLSSVKLVTHQRDVATTMLQHVEQHVPFYHDRLAPIRNGDGSFDFARWREIPVMTKSALIANYDELRSGVIPPAHGSVSHVESSSTTGAGVIVPTTQLTDLTIACASFRHFEAYEFEWSKDLVMIRAFRQMPRDSRDLGDEESGRWGPPWMSPDLRGKRHFLSVNEHPKVQITWLKSHPQIVINTNPSNAMRLVRWVAENELDPLDISVLLTVGEIVTADLRDQCRRYLNCEIVDAYSTSECGPIAFQCPVSGGYHIQSELVLAEIVNDIGEICDTGEPGRLVATPLMNFAMPLIRYRFDDYLVPGPPCACGRPGPLIQKILGRRDSLIELPDGSIDLLEVNQEKMASYLGKQRWQIAQIGIRQLELRFVEMAGEVTDTKGACNYIATQAGSGMKVTTRQIDALGPNAGGKFRNIINELYRKRA